MRVLPPSQMAKLMQSIDEMPNSDPKKVVFETHHRQRFRAGERGQGRDGFVCRTKWRARAGIKNDAVLVGLLDRFEIWNPDRYEKVQTADAALAPDAFKLME